ncbi:MAG: hypothetical protein Harvfovirus89_1, partial [Harvfovirus sp.]
FNLIRDMKPSIDNFEADLTSFSVGFDTHLVIDRKITHAKDITISHYESRYYVAKHADLVSNFYLIIEYDTLYLDLEERLNLLDSTIELRIGGGTIYKYSLSTSLLFSQVRDKKVIDSDNQIKIPISILDSFVDDLFPIMNLCYHDVFIYFDLNPKLQNKISHHISYTGYFYLGSVDPLFSNYYGENISGTHVTDEQTKKARRSTADSFFEFYILQSTQISLQRNFLSNEFRYLTKFIIFRFIPKKASTIYEYLDMQPQLDEIHVSLDNNPPLSFTQDKILTINFMGIKLYILILTPEISTLQKLKQTLKTKDYLNSGINFNKINLVRFDFILDIPTEEFDVIATPINLNIQRMISGMSGVALI